jgi:hypothetical protein
MTSDIHRTEEVCQRPRQCLRKQRVSEKERVFDNSSIVLTGAILRQEAGRLSGDFAPFQIRCSSFVVPESVPSTRKKQPLVRARSSATPLCGDQRDLSLH